MSINEKGSLPSRRNMLQLGGFLLGITAVSPGPRILSAASNIRDEFTRLFYIANCGGGPAGPDSFDMREQSTPHIDQIFEPIATAVPGMRVSELFPQIARRAGDVMFFRNCTTQFPDHLHAIGASLGRNKSGENILHRVARKAPGISKPFFAETPGCINAFNYRRRSYSVHDCLDMAWESDTPLSERTIRIGPYEKDMPTDIRFTLPPG